MGVKKGTLRRDQWISGPDLVDHRLFNDCQRSRAQAWFRGEEWFITEQEYIAIWRQDDRYLRKGRTRESLCMIRKDPELAWTIDNVEIIPRIEHFRNAVLIRKLQGII